MDVNSRIADALERIADALEKPIHVNMGLGHIDALEKPIHENIDHVDHAHIDDIAEIHGDLTTHPKNF